MSPGSSVTAYNREEEVEVSLYAKRIDGTVQPLFEQAGLSEKDSEVIISPSRTPISSYTAMTDPDEGTSLTFVQTQEFNGVKCARIEPIDVMPEIDYWKSSMMCFVLGANPPLQVLLGEFGGSLVKKGVFLVRFKFIHEQAIVVQRGVYYFDNKPFLVKPWNEEMDLNTETLASLPIWVKFLDLDIKYWGLDSLSKLGSMLGTPIKTDKYIKDKTFLKYARILIEIQLEDNFPEYIKFVNEHNVVVRQKVEYEWKPIKCDFYKMYGHMKDDCRKKPKPRIEWGHIVRQEPQDVAPSHPHIDKEGFITIRKKAMTTTAGNKNLPPEVAASQAPTTPVHNTFEILDAPEAATPNKQEDVKIFLYEKQIGFIGLLETKVKENKVEKIAHNIFQGWNWHHNFTLRTKGRI
ncbi:hypothetical protein Cgig2_029100 [Carnegiea gigantea]|uniref:DUF4283 domain-containing protein n=1 Tax=Carnegiea gigantea TaxID=171969 RepID=A0A9Q1GJG8_9CARY|nr:hypothetical protein Cgig2_029100 [Carnegiea gigantea]